MKNKDNKRTIPVETRARAVMSILRGIEWRVPLDLCGVVLEVEALADRRRRWDQGSINKLIEAAKLDPIVVRTAEERLDAAERQAIADAIAIYGGTPS